MKRVIVGSLLALVVCLVSANVSAASVSTHLHVLLAMDTDARAAHGVEGIGTARDLEIWSSVIGEIRRGREDRVSVTVMKGSDLTPDAVLNFYRQLGKRPGWALLFVYSGHGATGTDGDHYLTCTHGGNLARSRLREAMEGTGANLEVILTDCCGSVVPFTAPERGVPAEWAMFEQLFFEAGGMVDVLSCEVGADSFGNDATGGVFTRACTQLLCSPVSVSDGDHDGRVTWPEFFGRLQVDNQKIAASAGRRQVPSSWYLGGRKRFDDVIAGAQVHLQQAQPVLAALVARASAATRNGSRARAVREVQTCAVAIARINVDLAARNVLTYTVADAACRANLVDAQGSATASAQVAESSRTVSRFMAEGERMQAWVRRASGGGGSYSCH